MTAQDELRARLQSESWQTVRRNVNAQGDIVSETQVPERPPYTPIPDADISRRSTLVDAEGKVIQSWIIEKPDDELRRQFWQASIDALCAELPRVEPIPSPTASFKDLLAVYPVGDHHMGMLAWKYEVGESYDLDIGEAMLDKSMQHLVQCTMSASRALVVFLGDFMHYDSWNAETPTNRNPLDADGRFPKMVRAAVRAMRKMIETAAAEHTQVHVIIEIGNHDLASSIFLMEAMRNIYENNPRITIDTSPSYFHYYRFESNLIGVHHGHGVKIGPSCALPGIMAHDRAEDWGATRHRYWYTGHIHTQRSFDFPGCSVESFRILPPPDGWAFAKGYRSHRDMKAIVLHADYGEVARATINPEMLK